MKNDANDKKKLLDSPSASGTMATVPSAVPTPGRWQQKHTHLYEIFKLKFFERSQQGDNKSYQINKLKKFKLYEIFKFKIFTEREPPHPLLPDQKIKSQEN